MLLHVALFLLVLPPPPDEFLEFLVEDLLITTSEEFHRRVSEGRWDANSEGGNLGTVTLTRLSDDVSPFHKHERSHTGYS